MESLSDFIHNQPVTNSEPSTPTIENILHRVEVTTKGPITDTTIHNLLQGDNRETLKTFSSRLQQSNLMHEIVDKRMI